MTAPVGTAEEWQEVQNRADAIVDALATDPARFQPLMHECHVLLLDVAKMHARVVDELYAAEREHTRVESVNMGRNIDNGATFARAAAKVAALDAREKADDLKVLRYAIEGTQHALTQKHYALMNLNKGFQSAMFEGGRRG